MRTLEHPETGSLTLDVVLAALADPVRRRIVCELADSDHDRPCAAFDLPVSKSTSTHHFRVLREAGIIEQHYRGTSILSVLRQVDLETRFPGLLGSIVTSTRREREAADELTGHD